MKDTKKIIEKIRELNEALRETEDGQYRFLSSLGHGRVFLNDRRNIKKLVSFSAKKELIRMNIERLEKQIKETENENEKVQD